MAYRQFDQLEVSRRTLFRSSAYLAGGAALALLPFGRGLLAHDVSQAYPSVAALSQKYVDEGKVANLFTTFGWGEEDHAHTVGGGTLGLTRDTPVDENTLYRIYSMTKPVTGMAVMMLIDEGALGLDQPLYEILPAYKDMQVLVDPEGPLDQVVPAESPITIRQLLTHTAGLGYGITSKGPLLAAIQQNGLNGGRVSRFPIPGFPTSEPAPNLEAFADRLASLPLMYQPGTTWSYSLSLDLLGRVIEVVSGKTYPEFLQERIFGPCGMTSTYFTVPQSEIDRFTDNYGILNGTPLPIDQAASSVYLDETTVPWGGADLVSSPKDYDRFLRMLLNYGKLDNERVMSEAAVRIGTSDLLADTVDKSTMWNSSEGHGAGGRSVNGTYGWGGAAGTVAAVDYKLGLRTTLWTQYMPTGAFPIRAEFLAAVEADTAKLRKAKGV